MFSSRLFRQILLPLLFTAIYFPGRAQEFYIRANAANNYGIGNFPSYKIEGTVGGGSQQITYSDVNVKLGSGLALHANAGVFFLKSISAWRSVWAT